MSRVITFSRAFPAHHPKKGIDTFFVEGIYNALGVSISNVPEQMKPLINDFAMLGGGKKRHTIRAGKSRKVGDFFSPRIWSGKPYNSKQIIIYKDIQIKRIYNFEIVGRDIKVNGWTISPDELCDIAENDGLDKDDLLQWFQYPKPFKGQVICWDESINY